jgi:hypothetical protein
MTRHERSAQLWSLLIFAARNQQILSYSMVEKLTGLPKVGVADFLSPIQRYCEKHDLPPLTALVVNEKTGVPGSGFHRREDVFNAQASVFVYDWLRNSVPTAEDLQKADHHSDK